MMSDKSRATANAFVWKAKSKKHIQQLRITRHHLEIHYKHPKTIVKVEPVDLERNHCCLFERKDSFSTRPNSQQQFCRVSISGAGSGVGKTPRNPGTEAWNPAGTLLGTWLDSFRTLTPSGLETLQWSPGTPCGTPCGTRCGTPCGTPCGTTVEPLWNPVILKLWTLELWNPVGNPGTLDVCKSGTLVLGTLNVGNLHTGNPKAWQPLKL